MLAGWLQNAFVEGFARWAYKFPTYSVVQAFIFSSTSSDFSRPSSSPLRLYLRFLSWSPSQLGSLGPKADYLLCL